MMTPTMTLRQKDTVSSLVKRLRYSLREQEKRHQIHVEVKQSQTSASTTAAVVVVVSYGVSNMTLQTVAIVLKQSVVFSMGRFLFWKKTNRNESREQQGSVHCAGTKALTVSIYPATFWQKQESEHF